MIAGPMSWFARMLGIAVVAHIAGNSPALKGESLVSALSAATIALGFSAVWLIHRPTRFRLAATAAMTVVAVWLEAPFIGNHWILTGLVSLAVLVSLTRSDPWSWFAPTGRWMLLGFYAFAAFAKLNDGFFDPVESCGVFYANQSLGSIGLPTLPRGGALAVAVIVTTAVIENTIPVLLLFRRGRGIGVVLAVLFHTLISLDLDQHFYDFTATLLMLFGLFLTDRVTARFDETASRGSLLMNAGLGMALLIVIAAVVPVTTVTLFILRVGTFAVWIPFATWFVWSVVRSSADPIDVRLRVPGPAAAALVAIVILNGLTPYLELKTAFGFNMYANLETVAGDSNHFIVSNTVPLTSVQEDLLEVLATDDHGLDPYIDSGYLLPRRNLLNYLAHNPGAIVEVSDGVSVFELSGSDGQKLPVLAEKFLPFRAVDTHDPPRCQAAWLPAR